MLSISGRLSVLLFFLILLALDEPKAQDFLNDLFLKLLEKPDTYDVFIQLEFTTAGKFGINMKEDTTLNRFRYTAM